MKFARGRKVSSRRIVHNLIYLASSGVRIPRFSPMSKFSSCPSYPHDPRGLTFKRKLTGSQNPTESTKRNFIRLISNSRNAARMLKRRYIVSQYILLKINLLRKRSDESNVVNEEFHFNIVENYRRNFQRMLNGRHVQMARHFRHPLSFRCGQFSVFTKSLFLANASHKKRLHERVSIETTEETTIESERTVRQHPEN